MQTTICCECGSSLFRNICGPTIENHIVLHLLSLIVWIRSMYYRHKPLGWHYTYRVGLAMNTVLLQGIFRFKKHSDVLIEAMAEYVCREQWLNIHRRELWIKKGEARKCRYISPSIKWSQSQLPQTFSLSSGREVFQPFQNCWIFVNFIAPGQVAIKYVYSVLMSFSGFRPRPSPFMYAYLLGSMCQQTKMCIYTGKARNWS